MRCVSIQWNSGWRMEAMVILVRLLRILRKWNQISDKNVHGTVPWRQKLYRRLHWNYRLLSKGVSWSVSKLLTLMWVFGNWLSRILTFVVFFTYLVDGVWKDWAQWTDCTVTCGYGTRNRSRICEGPFYKGKDCEGPKDETESCNTFSCPGN